MEDLLSPEEVIPLWATTVLKQELPDAARFNPELERAFEEAPGAAPLALDSVAGHWLASHIGHGLELYCRRAGVVGNADWPIESRFVCREFGESRTMGSRARGYISGVYVVRFSDEVVTERNRGDLRPGAISFFDPRGSMNMNAIEGDPYLAYHRTLLPSAGDLLVWPGYLDYCVHPNLSDTACLTVEFDLLAVVRT